jgi:hypothetical protein
MWVKLAHVKFRYLRFSFNAVVLYASRLCHPAGRGREKTRKSGRESAGLCLTWKWHWPSPRWEAGDWHGQNLLLLFMSMRWGAQAEWQWGGKTDRLGEKPAAVPLCLPQIPHGLTQARFRPSTVRGRQWTAWAIESALSEFFPFGNTRQILKDVSI